MRGDGFPLSTYLHPAAKRFEPHVQHFGAALLRRRLTREALNMAYERWGAGFAAVACRAFSGSAVPTSFVWSARFADAEFRVPVTPRKQGSWNNALYWRWSAAQPIRRAYEWYLEHRSSCGESPVYLD